MHAVGEHLANRETTMGFANLERHGPTSAKLQECHPAVGLLHDSVEPNGRRGFGRDLVAERACPDAKTHHQDDDSGETAVRKAHGQGLSGVYGAASGSARYTPDCPRERHPGEERIPPTGGVKGRSGGMKRRGGAASSLWAK